MRTTNEIIIAVKESQPVTAEELRLALLASSSIEYFLKKSVRDLIEAIVEKKPSANLKAEFAKRTLDDMFQAGKTDPQKWLGPDNIPGNPGYDKRLEWGKRLFEKVTGEKL